MSLRSDLRKVYDFIFRDDSIWSWIANIVLAFLLVKFIIYPGLSLILGSSLPMVAVISGSMDHEGLSFGDWWAQKGQWYEEQGITKETFETYSFVNGFQKGDVMVLVGAKNVQQGDVAVYASSVYPYPIIHRVIYINENETSYGFKGDHNQGPDPHVAYQNQLIGRAVLRVPWIGWVKIWVVEVAKGL